MFRMLFTLFVVLMPLPCSAGIVAPHSFVEGKSISQWADDWWNWAVAEGESTNPIVDTTGEFSGRNQSGPVFFLAGTFGVPVNRSIIVPNDKYLLVPLINSAYWAPEDGLTETELRLKTTADIDAVTSLVFSLDGIGLIDPALHRESSAVGGFTLFSPPGSLLTDLGLPAGNRLAVSDGYWVMIEPLSAGVHQLNYGGTSGGFTTAVSATITAVPEPSSCTICGMLVLLSATIRMRRRRRL